MLLRVLKYKVFLFLPWFFSQIAIAGFNLPFKFYVKKNLNLRYWHKFNHKSLYSAVPALNANKHVTHTQNH